MQGHTDTPLCETGQEMARLLAERLHNEPLHAIITSDLRRAYETAEPLAQRRSPPIERDMRLREGRWPLPEREGEHPVLPFPVAVETPLLVRLRMVRAMYEIAHHHAGQRVLVVSHGGAIRQFIEHIATVTGDSWPPYRAVRTAINRFRFHNDRWTCLSMNDAQHLLGANMAGSQADAG